MKKLGKRAGALNRLLSTAIEVAARAMESIWFNIHGTPAKLSGDAELLDNRFKKAISR